MTGNNEATFEDRHTACDFSHCRYYVSPANSSI